MNDISRMLLLNRLCDSFDTCFDKSKKNQTVNVDAFVDDLRSSEQSTNLTDRFFTDLTTELLAIEIQNPPFPDKRFLVTKYPNLTDEISDAIQLLQKTKVGSPSARFDPPETPSSQLLLPIEESLSRSMPKNGHGENHEQRAGVRTAVRKLGRYHLLERLGAGGFGVVFKAHDPVMKRDVAIKIPRLSLASDTSAQSRLEQEISALAKLNHSNIVTAYHAEEIDGYFCLISEYIDGCNLEEWLEDRSKAVPESIATALGIQISKALTHAHQRGIVHCDIKPSNILVAEPGRAIPHLTLTDFGLSKLVRDKSMATSTGTPIGTLQYMSPEQLSRSEAANCTSDVYSVGIIMHRLLTHEYPFDSDNEIALISQILERQPQPLHQSEHQIPAALAAIISKCLMKRPEDRYQDASKLLSDFENYIGGKPVAAKRLNWLGKLTHWSRSKNRIRTAGTYSLLLSIVLATWSLFSMPVYYATGILDQMRVDSMTELLFTIVLLLLVLIAPLTWLAIKAIKLDARAIKPAVALSISLTLIMVMFLLDVLPFDFGGLYTDARTRIVSFTMLTVLCSVQSALYLIAWRASKS